MHEILRTLDSRGTVLDLGCGGGSFSWNRGRVIRLDRKMHKPPKADSFVVADAAFIPVPNDWFDFVICNHSLEHISNLDQALREIGRIVKPGGALFVAAPDASTLSDRLYRWLSQGGGHVNAFVDAASLAARIEALTGLRHAATRPLFSSLCFLNRDCRPSRPPRKLLLLGGGAPWSLRFFTLASRWADRLLKSRFSLYGWAMYFGELADPIETGCWPNVCIRCGSGVPSLQLRKDGKVYRRWHLLDCYDCPACSTWNFFFEDHHLSHVC